MAGDWIKMRINLTEDPAVVRIASGLSLDRFGIVGRLHRIWAWADEHSADGQDVPVDADFLDSLVATPGFSAQLRNVGWLSGRDGNLCFPNFSRHNGESAKARALDAERKRKARKTSGKTSAKCPASNRTKLGPEERREEKSIPPNPQGNSGELDLVIPEKLKTERFRAALDAWFAVIRQEKGRVNTPAVQVDLASLSEFSERKATALVRSWAAGGRYTANWKADWESYDPGELAVEKSRYVPKPAPPVKKAEVAV